MMVSTSRASNLYLFDELGVLLVLLQQHIHGFLLAHQISRLDRLLDFIFYGLHHLIWDLHCGVIHHMLDFIRHFAVLLNSHVAEKLL